MRFIYFWRHVAWICLCIFLEIMCSCLQVKDRDGHEQPSPGSPGGESDVIGSGMADTAIQGPNVSDEKLAWKEPMFSMFSLCFLCFLLKCSCPFFWWFVCVNLKGIPLVVHQIVNFIHHRRFATFLLVDWHQESIGNFVVEMCEISLMIFPHLRKGVLESAADSPTEPGSPLQREVGSVEIPDKLWLMKLD